MRGTTSGQSNRRYPRYFRTTCPFRSSTYILSFDLLGSERDMLIPSASHHPFTCQLMNSLPVSGCAESQGNGRSCLMASMLTTVASCPLFHCVRVLLQYAAESMALKEYAKSPTSVSPQCATVSICS